MRDLLSRVGKTTLEMMTSLAGRIRFPQSRTAIIAGTAAGILLLSGIAIALAIHSISVPADEPVPEPADRQRDVVRPVRIQDFRFPRMHLEGPEGDFFRYRDPTSAWSEEEVSRMWLDLEQKAVDIVREENSELLEELLNTRP